jgi:hypothetical protein
VELVTMTLDWVTTSNWTAIGLLFNGIDGLRDAISAATAKPTPNFVPPTNPPQNPPQGEALPPGHTLRVMPPTAQYPNGYWRQYNGAGQPVDPSTGKPPGNVSRPEARARTHIPLPGSRPLPKP